ncbi:MAG: hypothetical protein H6739_03920 [Alphaproteobacteria bacterium]|nr:hypothetical protein [Alphaproteobacteria bacterium]
MLLLPALLLACRPSLPQPFMDLDGGFFDYPWPSVEASGPNGGPTFDGFPKADEIELLAEYTALADEVIEGASNNAPAFFRFDAPIDVSALPDPAGSLELDSPIFIVDVDPYSPTWGQRVPVQWDFQEAETAYQPENLLAFGPIWGWPLRPETTYAAVVTTDIASRNPAVDELFDPANPDYADTYEPARLALFEMGVPMERVAALTVFTTQRPTSEMEELSWRIREHLGQQELDQPLTFVTRNQFFELWEGRLFLPVWQHGERPYASEGGGFERGEDGWHEIYAWERVAFSLTIPINTETPPGGWPLVLYAHGTGGDHQSCCSTRYTTSPAANMARAGFAVMGVAQPLHDDRATPGTIPDLHTFNFLNPRSGRTNFRQGALDTVYLATVLTGRQHVFDADGEPLPLNPDRVAFMGHSQGGITGAIALPFISDRIRAAMLSGAGGGMSMTVVYREQGGLDIEALLREALDFDYDEELDLLHPTVALIQTLTDVTDPLSYAPWWFQEEGPLGLPPVSVLMTEGMEDEHTPPITTEALAAAAGLPIVQPAEHLNDAHVLAGLGTVSLPAVDNLRAYDDRALTGALAQFPDQDHFVIFELQEATLMVRAFLSSALEDSPRIEAP